VPSSDFAHLVCNFGTITSARWRWQGKSQAHHFTWTRPEVHSVPWERSNRLDRRNHSGKQLQRPGWQSSWDVIVYVVSVWMRYPKQKGWNAPEWRRDSEMGARWDQTPSTASLLLTELHSNASRIGGTESRHFPQSGHISPKNLINCNKARMRR